MATGGVVVIALSFVDGFQPYQVNLLWVFAGCAFLPAVSHQLKGAPQHVVYCMLNDGNVDVPPNSQLNLF